MSELAFNANGESFEVPATVTGWRVRRMKPRGAPELVYGRDGRPLTISIESDMNELRAAVGALGKYRLDPINDDGRTIDSVPAAYIQVVKPDQPEPSATAIVPAVASDDTIREAMRLNTELARSVIDRFPEMMTAAAELLRAADGAGIPARQPRIGVSDDDQDDEDEDPDDAEAARAGFDLNAIVGQLVPLLMAGLSSGKLKLPNFGAMFDWRKAAADANPSPAPKRDRRAESGKASLGPAVEDEPTTADDERDAASLPPMNAATMAHFVAVQAMLSPEESALAREVASELKPAELRAWFDELSKLDVAEAAQKIRQVIGGAKAGVS